VINKSISLDAEHTREFDQRLAEAAFWKMPARTNSNVMVADGAQLIMEGVEQGRYHVVTRVLPGASYKSLCRHMLSLSGFEKFRTWEEYHSTQDAPET
jgi:hypothetical protein